MNNNKGYSLTELLLAIFILSIVMLGIAGIMRSTSQFYRNGTQEVRVQEEAQLAVNLIEEMLVDADADNASQRPTWDATTERLSFYNEEGKHINITYQHPSGDPKGQLLMGYWENPDDSGNYIVETLADYVTGFEVKGIDYDVTHANADNKIEVSVSMDNNGYEYTASKEVYMRNLVENPTISINTVPSGGGGAGGTWDHEVVLDRFDTYNLTTWYSIDPTKPVTSIGDFDSHFSKTIDANGVTIAVNASYCQNLSATSGTAGGVQCTDINGNTVKIGFSFVPVKVYVSPSSDVYVHYPHGTNVNGAGYETYVEAEGININKAIAANGISGSVKITINDSSETKSNTFSLSAQSGNINISNSQQFMKQIAIGVVPDPQAPGLAIGACNGAQINGYNPGSSAKMKVEVTLSPTSGASAYSNTLEYKFRIAGNVL